MQFSLRRLFLVVTLVAIALGLECAFARALTYVESGEGIKSVNWLPSSATNISFYKSYVFTAYEFDIPESDFREWARRWDLQPVTSPCSIDRYAARAYPTHDFRHPHSAWIEDGLFYEHRQGNGGGVAVGYDRELGRAFFWTSPR